MRYGRRELETDAAERLYDIPWLVLDCARANHLFKWTPKRSKESVFDEIARFADENPNWLEMTAPN
jgi:CDP-paratose 2-epimerase